ncbi:unnamed protein product [Dovyalis caffra]|uniref:Uncharacterized protein n=1 Tax=Dovyalis caffra TaxID=77055 RepID=A0AAV1SD10_9ROSI|nr:unnamed protein product [Dovyalis caffra]
MRHAAGPGLNGKDNSDSGLGASKRAKCSKSDLEQNCTKRTLSESKVAAADNVVSLKSPLKTNGKTKTPVQVVKLRETDLNDTGISTLTSLRDQKRGDGAKLLPKEDEKSTLVEVHMTRITVPTSICLRIHRKIRERGILSQTTNSP